MEVSDEDIQVLMKLTLLTPTNKKIRAIIPYLKKFCPKVELSEKVPTYIPLFHTLQIQASSQAHQETATIDMSPLILNPHHEHYLNVQTYSNNAPEKAGSRYALHVQFAQMIVKSKEANYLEVQFKGILLKVTDPKVKQLRPFLKVAVSHGSSWSSKERAGHELATYNQSTILMFHSLLDIVILQLFHDKIKLCQCKKFIFQLIGQGSRFLDLQGEVVKRSTIKFSTRSNLPIVIID